MSISHVEHWSNDEVGPVACTTHSGDFGLGAKFRRLGRRLTDTLDAQRQRAVDREVACLLAQSGGRLTDSLEREIMQKVFASEWSLPQ